MMIKVRPLTNVRECARVARFTQGMEGDSLSLATWRKWLWSEHSMIRVFTLSVKMYDIPSFASVHFTRHKVSIHPLEVEHFVRSQRPTALNPVDYDRGEAPQNQLINHALVLNPQGLINMSRKRLCNKADPVVLAIWRQVRATIAAHDNPFVAAIAEVMLPNCEYRGGCHEIVSCGSYEGRRNK